MNNNKLSILFLLQKVRTNKQGMCPVRCRITYQQKRKEFSTGLFIKPSHWSSKQQKAKPPNKENDFTNKQISLMRQKLNQAFLYLEVQDSPFDVETIYFQYKGDNLKKDFGTVEYFKLYLERLNKLVGVEIKQPTWNKFSYLFTDVVNFVKWKWNRKDVLLKNLDMDFLMEFEFYLKTEKDKKQITVNKNIQRFKKVVKSAVSSKYLDDFPFDEHQPKRVKTEVVYLTTDELDKLKNYQFAQPRLAMVRDMFVFCCYTGLPFLEMSSLEEKHIIENFDGQLWIKMNRVKTSKIISVPLLKPAREILDAYASDNEKLLPKLSNQKFNSYLKEIADIIGIEKRLTHHIARKTFATTVLLFNDVPMEIVSELLGHSKITITQEHYAKVVQKKVSEQMKNLGKKLSEM